MGEVRRITPSIPKGARLFGARGTKPPFILDKPGTTYVLTSDIVADRTAIEVKADRVTIDLNGHTVTYHNKTIPKETFSDPWMSYVHKGAVGVKNFGHSKFVLLNGIIREGAGMNGGNTESTGFTPIYLRNCSDVLVAGVTVDYHTPQNTGMRFRNAGDKYEIHHCVFLDRGCVIRNRHGAAVRALSFLAARGKGYNAHHNLVKRTRQMGILGPSKLNHNEIYVDSWSVNSFALEPCKVNGEARHNRVFGTGVNVQGFGWGESGVRIHHNLIHLEGIGTGRNRNKEGWGDQDSLNGLRLTNYGKGGQKRDDLLYHDNLIVIRCRDGAQARGTEFFSDETITGLVLRDSIIKVETLDTRTSQVACVVTHGLHAKADTSLPVYYENCTLISNLCNVRFGDYYGRGSNHRFVKCTFIRTGTDTRYHTFVADGAYWCKRNVVLDCRFLSGARFDDIFWKRTGWQTFYDVQWTLTIETVAGAKITITDSTGKTVFDGLVHKNGKVQVPLTHCRIQKGRRQRRSSTSKRIIKLTPHTVRVNKGDGEKTITIDMTAPKTVRVSL